MVQAPGEGLAVVAWPEGHRVEARLGAGSFGEVVRATDPQGRAVALKRLAPEQARQPDRAWAFELEAARLGQLDHPAFPKAFGLLAMADGARVLAMELAEGEAPAGPMGPAALRALMVPLADALAHLHARGWAHGDLQPGNLRLGAGGRVWILDLGLMAPLGAPRATVSGTPAYLAPEVWRLSPVAASADLYALGAIAHHLASGQAPFGGGPGALAAAHLASPPPPLPAEWVSEDPDLAKLILALMAKAPEARPASAAHLLAALKGEAPPPPPAPSLRRHCAAVGLASLLAPVQGPWAPDMAGPQGAWWRLEGEAGSGKSRALAELRGQALAWGRPVVATAADGATASAARRILGQALALAGRSPSPDLGAWLSGQASPGLAGLEPAARASALAALGGGALAEAAQSLGGLVVLVDAAEALDPSDRELLGAWGRRGDVAADWVVASGPEAPALGPEEAGLVKLKAWGAGEVGALAALALGATPPAPLVAHLLQLSGGLPALVWAALDLALADGRLRQVGGEWAFDAEASGQASLGSALLSEAWGRRLGALGPEARRLGEALAVAFAAGPCPPEALGEALGLAAADLAKAWADLSAQGAAREDEAGAWRLADASVAQALRPAKATRLSELAEAMAAALGPWQEAEAWPAARLYLGASLAAQGHDAGMALALVAAATRRALALATPEAVAGPLDALDRHLASPGASHGPALAARMARLELARWRDRLAVLAAEAPALEAEARAQGRLDWALAACFAGAKALQLQGAYPQAQVAFERARDQALALKEAAWAARAWVALGRVRLYLGDRPGARQAAAEGALAAGAQAPARAAALILQGALLAEDEPARAEEAKAMLLEAKGLAEAVGDRLGVGTALENLGNVALAAGAWGEARLAFAEAEASLKAMGAHTEALGASLNLAILAAHLGLADAPAQANAVARLAKRLGRHFFVAAARSAEGEAAWRLGRPAEAEGPLNEALGLAQSIQNRYLEGHVRTRRLEAFVALGRREEALAEAEALGALAPGAEAQARLALSLGALAWQGGDHVEALRVAEAQVGQADAALAREAKRLGAWAHLGLGEGDAAARWAGQALATSAAWGQAGPMGDDLALLAQALWAVGKSERAEELALEALRMEGASPWAQAQAAVALGRHAPGLRARAALDAAADRLRPGVLALPPEQRAGLLAAWALEGLSGSLDRRNRGEGTAQGPERLVQALAELAMADDERALAEAALRGGLALAAAERGYVLLFEDGALARVITHGLDYEAESAAGFSTSIAQEAFASGEPLYLADAGADLRFNAAASVAALGLTTVVALPMRAGHEGLGVLYLDRQAIEPILGPSDLALLQALALATADALRRCRLAEASAAEAAAAVALADCLGLAQPTWQDVAEAALLSAPAEGAFVLAQEPGGHWRCEAAAPLGTPAPEWPEGQWAHVLRSGEALASLDPGPQPESPRWRLGWTLPLGEGRVLHLDGPLGPEPAAHLPGLRRLAAAAQARLLAHH